MSDQARAALLIAAVVLGGGIAIGRSTAPVPPAIVAPAPVAPVVETPKAAPKITPIPKLIAPAPIMRPERRVKAKKKQKVVRTARGGDSCAAIRRQAQSMSWSQKMAAYQNATPAQIAHGRRCLGM